MTSTEVDLSAIPLPDGVRLTVAEAYDPVFADALFYEPKVVLATLDGPGGPVVIVRSGPARVYDHRLGKAVAGAKAFRRAYPDGVVPEDHERMEWSSCESGFFPTRPEKVGRYPEFFDQPTLPAAIAAAAKIAARPGYTKEDSLAELLTAYKARFGSRI